MNSELMTIFGSGTLSVANVFFEKHSILRRCCGNTALCGQYPTFPHPKDGYKKQRVSQTGTRGPWAHTAP